MRSSSKTRLYTALGCLFCPIVEKRLPALRNNRRSGITKLIDTCSEVLPMLQLVTTDLLNKQIAGQLNLSEISVKLHRRHVIENMKVGSLAELVKMCERD